jgi:hypothetical protein
MVAFQVAGSRLVHIQIYFKQTGVSFIRACFVIYLASPFISFIIQIIFWTSSTQTSPCSLLKLEIYPMASSKGQDRVYPASQQCAEKKAHEEARIPTALSNSKIIKPLNARPLSAVGLSALPELR